MNDLTDINLENLRWLLDDLWIDHTKAGEVDSTVAFVRALDSRIRSEAELFVFCGLYPWAYNWNFAQKALSHSKCTEAVARRFYWQCSPSFLYRRQEKAQEFRPEHVECWRLIGEIEQGIEMVRWPRGYMAFAPSDVFGKPIRDDDIANPGNRLIPAEMKKCLDGRLIDIYAVNKLIYSK